MKLVVSIPCFQEIAGLLEKEGVKIPLGFNQSLTLEKGTSLIPPIDYRLVTIRRDCLIEAAKCYKPNVVERNWQDDFIEFVDKIYNYVLNEKK